jgi:hypothetical protein
MQIEAAQRAEELRRALTKTPDDTLPVYNSKFRHPLARPEVKAVVATVSEALRELREPFRASFWSKVRLGAVVITFSTPMPLDLVQRLFSG